MFTETLRKRLSEASKMATEISRQYEISMRVELGSTGFVISAMDAKKRTTLGARVVPYDAFFESTRNALAAEVTNLALQVVTSHIPASNEGQKSHGLVAHP